MSTYWEKRTCCQPVAVSLMKVAVARSWPPAVQRWPTCVPVLSAPLKKRRPRTLPASALRNLRPTSIGTAAGDGLVRYGTAGAASLPHSEQEAHGCGGLVMKVKSFEVVELFDPSLLLTR